MTGRNVSARLPSLPSDLWGAHHIPLPRPPMVTSGLRIGTPALATRGFDAEGFEAVAGLIAEALIAVEPDEAALAARVSALAASYPLYTSETTR